MINYPVDPALLAPFLPPGTELDFFGGRTFVSMVGFRFCDALICGVPIPWHRTFEEVNLRFYVRRAAPEGWRRGVVFISEIVPRRAIAAVARVVYNEKYRAMPMRHTLDLSRGAVRAEYGWKHRGRWNSLAVVGEGEPARAGAGSEEEFITEHFWGYTLRRDGGCSEYEVEHARWRLWKATSATLNCDAAGLYGEGFAATLAGEPSSAFLAEGAPVTVRRGVKLLPA